MKQLLFITLFVMYFVSCSNNKKYVIEQYSAISVEFEKEKVKNSNGDYYLTTPLNWELTQHESYLDIIYVHSYRGDGDDTIEIYKLTSDKDLKELNESFVESVETLIAFEDDSFKIIDYGETDILKYPSYFVHTSQYSNFEQISFVLKSKQKGVYYRLIAIGEKQNMPMMLQCLKSFEVLK